MLAFAPVAAGLPTAIPLAPFKFSLLRWVVALLLVVQPVAGRTDATGTSGRLSVGSFTVRVCGERRRILVKRDGAPGPGPPAPWPQWRLGGRGAPPSSSSIPRGSSYKMLF